MEKTKNTMAVSTKKNNETNVLGLSGQLAPEDSCSLSLSLSLLRSLAISLSRCHSRPQRPQVIELDGLKIPYTKYQLFLIKKWSGAPEAIPDLRGLK